MKPKLNPLRWIVLALLIAGCNTQLDPARLKSNESLRAACAALNQSDAEIEADLAIVEQDRLNGASRTSAINTATQTCNSQACRQCLIALINQIYGS